MTLATTLTLDRRPLAERSAALGRVAGICFLVLAAQFMTVIMLAAGMAPEYDYAGGAISDLGAMPATAALFNASLLAVGILNLIGGLALSIDRGRWWPGALAGGAAVGAIGAALLPLGTSGWHGIFALAAFVLFNVQTFAFARLVDGPLRWVALSLGTVGVAYIVVMIIGDGGYPAVFGPIGHGGAERLIVYPPMFWLMVFGGWLTAAR